MTAHEPGGPVLASARAGDNAVQAAVREDYS
jgi:hypothetical protein